MTRKADITKSTKASNIILGVGAVISAAMTGVLATISMPVGIMAFGFIMLAFFMLFEQNRRRNWEQKADKRYGSIANGFNKSLEFASLQANIETHQKLLQHQGALIDENRKRLNRLEKQMQNSKAQVKPVKAKTIVKTTATMTMPVKKLKVANDEPESYYNNLSDTVVRALVSSAVRHEKIAVFGQSLMRLPEGTMRGVEVFSRVKSRPGHYLPARRYVDIAKADNMMDMIEPLMLMQTLESLKSTAEQGVGADNQLYFVNITAQALKNKIFMTRLLTFLKQNRGLAKSLVFEMSQVEFTKASQMTLKLLLALGQLQCSFSLDHVKSLNFQADLLIKYRMRFVRIDARMLVNMLGDKDTQESFRAMKRGLERRGIGLIAEKIEDQATLDVVNSFDMHYGQGYVFDKPTLLDNTLARAA